MPNIKSQVKRVAISAKEKERNSIQRSMVKNAIKKFNKAIEEKDVAKATELLPATISLINKAKSKGVYHANTASRKISTLTRTLNALAAKAE